MQRLQPMQNPHSGSKIKIPKSMSNSILQIIQSCSVEKTAPKTLNIREMRTFLKWAIMQRLQPMQNPHFWSKITIPKKITKPILQIIQSCSVKKTAPKKTKYSRNGTILKMGHHVCFFKSTCAIVKYTPLQKTWLQKRPPGGNLGEHRSVRRSGTTSIGILALVFCWRMLSYTRTEVLTVLVEQTSTQGQLNTTRC